MKIKTAKWFSLKVILILTTFVVAGYFTYQKIQAGYGLNPTKYWRTYKTNNYLLKTPWGWRQEAGENFVQFFNYSDSEPGRPFGYTNTDEKKLKIEISEFDWKDSLESYVELQKKEHFEIYNGEPLSSWVEAKTTITGVSAILIESGSSVSEWYIIKIPQEDTVLSIVFFYDFPTQSELIKQILSTFKFLD